MKKSTIFILIFMFALNFSTYSKNLSLQLKEIIKREDFNKLKNYIRSNDINSSINPKTRETLLHYVLKYNPSLELVKFLITQGIDVNAVDIFNRTPLTTFLYYHNVENKNNQIILEYLLEHGAYLDPVDIEGNSPLSLMENQIKTLRNKFVGTEKESLVETTDKKIDNIISKYTTSNIVPTQGRDRFEIKDLKLVPDSYFSQLVIVGDFYLYGNKHNKLGYIALLKKATNNPTIGWQKLMGSLRGKRLTLNTLTINENHLTFVGGKNYSDKYFAILDIDKKSIIKEKTLSIKEIGGPIKTALFFNNKIYAGGYNYYYNPKSSKETAWIGVINWNGNLEKENELKFANRQGFLKFITTKDKNNIIFLGYVKNKSTSYDAWVGYLNKNLTMDNSLIVKKKGWDNLQDLAVDRNGTIFLANKNDKSAEILVIDKDLTNYKTLLKWDYGDFSIDNIDLSVQRAGFLAIGLTVKRSSDGQTFVRFMSIPLPTYKSIDELASKKLKMNLKMSFSVKNPSKNFVVLPTGYIFDLFGEITPLGNNLKLARIALGDKKIVDIGNMAKYDFMNPKTFVSSFLLTCNLKDYDKVKKFFSDRIREKYKSKEMDLAKGWCREISRIVDDFVFKAEKKGKSFKINLKITDKERNKGKLIISNEDQKTDLRIKIEDGTIKIDET